MKIIHLMVFLSAAATFSQTRQEARDAIAEVEELVVVARELSSESAGEELPGYAEKKISFVEVQLAHFKAMEQNASDTDVGVFQTILSVFQVLSEFMKRLIALSNAYIRTEFLLERNLDALERAEDQVEPDNYQGLNHLQGGWHFYDVHAVGLGLDKQKDKMASESSSQPVDEGAALVAAADNSNRSMEFVQKSMAIAREESGARRFLEMVDKAMESLDGLENVDEEFRERVETDFAAAEEAYSVNNYILASKLYENLLKLINDYLISRGSSKEELVEKLKEGGGKRKVRASDWVRPLSIQLKGGVNYLSTSDQSLSDSARAVILSDTTGGTKLFSSDQSPWSSFAGLQLKKKGMFGGALRYHIDNYAEYSTFNQKDKLSAKLIGESFSVTSQSEFRRNGNFVFDRHVTFNGINIYLKPVSDFPENSFYRSQLKGHLEQRLPWIANFRLEEELSGEFVEYYNDGSENSPSNQRLQGQVGLKKGFGLRLDLGIGVQGEVKELKSNRRSYTAWRIPLSVSSVLGSGSLIWSLGPQFKDYYSDEVSDRYNILSYLMLSHPLGERMSLSIINDLEYLLYQKNPREFRDSRLNQISTLRWGYSSGNLNLSLEYHLDWIQNENAKSDSLYFFNRNENQVRNRLGLNGYLILYKSINYTSKISLGLIPGVVHHTFEEDSFYRNMVLGQSYFTLTQNFTTRTGLDISLTYDGGWDRKSFFSDPDLLRDNLFLGANFYVNLK